MSLGPKQQRFVEEYLKDLNATQAAERAGYSLKTAASQGSRLLKNVEIAAELAQRQKARTDAADFDATTVLKELVRIATSDIGEAFDGDGNLRKLKDIPPNVRRAISGVEVDELFEGRGEERASIGLVRKVKLWDKVKALELLGKNLKLFVDKIEHSGTVTLEQLVEASMKKPEGKP